MAGIGFELKKIYRGGVFNSIKGAVYSSLTTIGPLIMIMSSLMAMYIFLDYNYMDFYERDLLASTVLYVFVFSLIVTSPVNSVLSRFIADKLYDENLEDILASYHVGIFINMILASVLGIPFACYEFFHGGVDAIFVLFSYCMYIALVFTFYNMTYISALKEYRKIALSFFAGMVVALISALVMAKVYHIAVYRSIVYAFAIGFTLIAILLYILVKSFFKISSRNYKETFSYFGRFKSLFFTNLFYTLGLYVHNFIFWTTPYQLVVVDTFVSAPVYDMATCVAVFINMSTMVIFVVQVETAFHDKYTMYCEAVIAGTVKEVLQTKADLLNTLRNKLIYVAQQQLLINVILYFLALIFLPRMGINGLVLEILPSLAVSYFVIFIMYTIIVFLYYFEDRTGALLTSAIFLAVSLVGTLFSVHLRPSLYGAGVFLGALAGFIFGYVRLVYVGNRLNYHIYCRGTIIEESVIREGKHRRRRERS